MFLHLPGFMPRLLGAEPEPEPEPDSVAPGADALAASPRAGPPANESAAGRERERSSFMVFLIGQQGREAIRRWRDIAAALQSPDLGLKGAVDSRRLVHGLDAFERRLFNVDAENRNVAFGDSIWSMIDQGLPLLERFAKRLADPRIPVGTRRVALAALIERLDVCGPAVLSELQDRLRDLAPGDSLIATARRVLERLVDERIKAYVLATQTHPVTDRPFLDIHVVNGLRRAIYPGFGREPPQDMFAARPSPDFLTNCQSALCEELTPALLSSTLADEAAAAFEERLCAALGVAPEMLRIGLPCGPVQSEATDAALRDLATAYGALPPHALLVTSLDAHGAVVRLHAEPSLLARHFHETLLGEQAFDASASPLALARWFEEVDLPDGRLQSRPCAVKALSKGQVAWRSVDGEATPIGRRDLGRLSPRSSERFTRIAGLNDDARALGGALPKGWLIEPARIPIWCDRLPDDRLQAALARHGPGLAPGLRTLWQDTLVLQRRHALLEPERLGQWAPRASALSPRLLSLAFQQGDPATLNAVLSSFLDLALTRSNSSSRSIVRRLRDIGFASSQQGLWAARANDDASAATAYVALIGEAQALGWLAPRDMPSLLRPCPALRHVSFWDLMMGGTLAPRFIAAYLAGLGTLVTQGRLPVPALAELLGTPQDPAANSAMEAAFRLTRAGNRRVLIECLMRWREAGWIDDATFVVLSSGDRTPR